MDAEYYQALAFCQSTTRRQIDSALNHNGHALDALLVPPDVGTTYQIAAQAREFHLILNSLRLARCWELGPDPPPVFVMSFKSSLADLRVCGARIPGPHDPCRHQRGVAHALRSGVHADDVGRARPHQVGVGGRGPPALLELDLPALAAAVVWIFGEELACHQRMIRR